MTTKYVRLQNGKKMEIYDCVITNSCILKFINTDVETVKTFLGTDLIDTYPESSGLYATDTSLLDRYCSEKFLFLYLTLFTISPVLVNFPVVLGISVSSICSLFISIKFTPSSDNPY